jgi:hypothetical protein
MSVEDATARRGVKSLRHQIRRLGRSGRSDPAAALLVLLGLVSLIVIAVEARGYVHQLYRDADTAVAFVLPQLAGHRPPGTTIDLGNHNYYETWWFERATIGLPDHFLLWELALFAVDFVGVAAVSWTAAVALGRRAALYTAVALLVIGDGMRQVVFEPDVRVGLLVHMAALCLALIFVWRRAEAHRLRPVWLIGVGGTLTLFTSAGGTDQLLMIDGVAPFVIAALVWWWLNGSSGARTTALFAVAVGLGSLAGEALLTTVMVHDGVSSSLNLQSFQFLESGTLGSDVGNTLSSWVSLADGDFFGLPVNKADTLTLILGALALAALGGAILLVARSARAWWVSRQRSRLLAPRGESCLFIAFWGASMLLTFASYSLTSASTTVDARYLLSAWVAVAALLGAITTSTSGRAVLASLLVLFSAIMIRDNVSFGAQPPGVYYPANVVGQIERYARSHNAATGFASYPYSHNLTWATRFALKVYPVWPCDAGRPGQVCQRVLSSDSAWFIPHAGMRTFLITSLQPDAIHAAPRSFGSPIAHATFGQFTVSVFGHDVAAQILQY